MEGRFHGRCGTDWRNPPDLEAGRVQGFKQSPAFLTCGPSKGQFSGCFRFSAGASLVWTPWASLLWPLWCFPSGRKKTVGVDRVRRRTQRFLLHPVFAGFGGFRMLSPYTNPSPERTMDQFPTNHGPLWFGHWKDQTALPTRCTGFQGPCESD